MPKHKPQNVSHAKAKHVPKDVVQEILYRLPLKSLVRFMSVCKEFSSWISDPRFVEAYRARQLGGNHQRLILIDHPVHFHNNQEICYYTMERHDITNSNNHHQELALAPLKVPPVITKMDSEFCSSPPTVLGSYNGLVAMLLENETDDFIMWNPLTNEYKTVSGCPGGMVDGFWSYTLYGLCYDESSNDYVAVAALNYQSPPGSPTNPLRAGYQSMKVYLMNFRTGRCTTLGPAEAWDQNMRLSLLSGGVSTVVRGVPHWVVEFYNFIHSKVEKEILYFDLQETKFKQMARPPKLSGEGKIMLGLGSLDGQQRQLCVTLQDKIRSCFEVWVMKDYNNLESWTNMFVIRDDFGIKQPIHSMDVLGFLENGECLIDVNYTEVWHQPKKLWGYDPERGSLRQIQIMQCNRADLKIVASEPSLISPPQPIVLPDESDVLVYMF